MPWKMQKILSASKKLRGALAISCVSWASLAGCSKGLSIQICVVDAARSGFQCAGQKIKSHFIPFSDGKDLMCASPKDTEEFLKECKQHVVLAITTCSYDGASFLCIPPQNPVYRLLPLDADNFACVSSQDFRRLQERCK